MFIASSAAAAGCTSACPCPPGYLEATVTMAAVAREAGANALVNMSQMTVSEMSIQNTTPSHQQRQHWLGEQALAGSGLPVVTIRPTMFLESFSN